MNITIFYRRDIESMRKVYKREQESNNTEPLHFIYARMLRSIYIKVAEIFTYATE